MGKEEGCDSNDLPLSANVQDVSVKHFILDVSCDMTQRVFEGSITLWCLPTHTHRAVNCQGVTRDTISDTIKFDEASTSEKMENIGATPCVQQTSSSASNRNARLNKPLSMILDCHQVDVRKVQGVRLHGDERRQFEEDPDSFIRDVVMKRGNFCLSQRHSVCSMTFTVKEHCVEIFAKEEEEKGERRKKEEKTESKEKKEEVKKEEEEEAGGDCEDDGIFPHIVQIWYGTRPSGPSLKWTTDQNEQSCVFTAGHFLSNRSLFPSQDVPCALCTWQAAITVQAGLTAVTTGDQDPHISFTEDGRKRFSFFTEFPMPTCTFALAVGCWEMERLNYAAPVGDETDGAVDKPPVRLLFPAALRERSLSALGSYLPCCLMEVQRLLGRYPLRRLDVLIVPPCFDSLGMASPSLLFLSQSVLCHDGSMCVRVAHELCHTWFGIVIGPQDWTEEWMTEGFCTYLEDILHARVIKLGAGTEDYLGLRAELHLTLLRAELNHTGQHLTTLRPSQGREDCPSTSSDTNRFIKDGRNAEKKFMQVHYLKGYFLLHALEREVGREGFLSFLKNYVSAFQWQLVTSQEFLQMFFSTFTDLKHLSVEDINAQWLDCPGMPTALAERADNNDRTNKNSLLAEVEKELTSVVKCCRRSKSRKRRSGGQPVGGTLPEGKQMLAPQVMLLFDWLLDEKQLPGHVLDLLRKSYHLHLDNAEVCHRWCELVIKHRCQKWYPDVRQFLIQHQAMGVYLYGEAVISRCPHVTQLARECFQQLRHDMTDSVCDTVSAMLYGT